MVPQKSIACPRCGKKFSTKHSGGLSLGASLSPHKPPPMWADIRSWNEVAILGASDSLAFKVSLCQEKFLNFQQAYTDACKSLKSSTCRMAKCA